MTSDRLSVNFHMSEQEKFRFGIGKCGDFESFSQENYVVIAVPAILTIFLRKNSKWWDLLGLSRQGTDTKRMPMMAKCECDPNWWQLGWKPSPGEAG